VLVTFPAAATIFTDRAGYGLSSAQYGAMFLPQVVTAIAGALAGARLARRIGTRQVYLLGLALSLAAMALLLISAPVQASHGVAYPLLLLATAGVGAGFGLTVPVLNTYASAFRPAAVDSAVLTLNALLGLGTVAAPVFVAVFVGLGFWWGLPAVSAALLAFLLLASIRLPLRVSAVPAARASRAAGRGMPARFWLYAVLIGLYGICETMNGNWSQLEMTGHVRASTAAASLALAAFWGMVTLGRVLFALIDRWLPAPAVYRLLPLVLIISFLLTGLLAHGQAGAGIFVFALAGLGCSALLPLTISFGERDMTAVAPAVSGGVIAFYQVGYGIAAFSVGPLLHAGISLPEIFAGTAAAAAVLGVLATAVARRQRAVPAAGHTGHAGHAGALPSAASRGAGEVTRPRSG